MSLSLPPVPPHASQTSLPPPKHSLHLVETTPLPLQISHSTTPFSVVSFPVPLHSSHFVGILPVPLHLPQLTSPVPLHVVHTKIENLNLTNPVSRLTEATRQVLLNVTPPLEIPQLIRGGPSLSGTITYSMNRAFSQLHDRDGATASE